MAPSSFDNIVIVSLAWIIDRYYAIYLRLHARPDNRWLREGQGDGIQIHVEEQGSTDRALVLLHYWAHAVLHVLTAGHLSLLDSPQKLARLIGDFADGRVASEPNGTDGKTKRADAEALWPNLSRPAICQIQETLHDQEHTTTE